MVFNPRSGNVPDGAIDAAKLADGAVTNPKLATDAVTGAKIAADAVENAKLAAAAVTSAKLADNAVVAGKIAAGGVHHSGCFAAGVVTEVAVAADAITTPKIASGAVTLVKAVDALRRKALVGSEANVSVTGTARKRVERFQIPKETSFLGVELLTLVHGKVTGVGTGTVEVWLDDENWDANDLYTGAGTPCCTATISSTTGEIVAMTADLSALSSPGKHSITVSLKGSATGVTVESDLREYFIKE